jgi:GH15 family glucan-1,4-alpha-glucosidase
MITSESCGRATRSGLLLNGFGLQKPGEADGRLGGKNVSRMGMPTLGMNQLDEATRRIDGYAPLRHYAAIGDGRTVALVARDGSIDWLPMPNLDSASVFAAILDRRRGGSFTLEPACPHRVERRYLPGTNVVETTFITDRGTARVTDALTLPGNCLEPFRELQRRVDGVSGRVSFRWRIEPRFGYGSGQSRLDRRSGLPVATAGADALAVCAFGAGEPTIETDAISGGFDAVVGESSVLALAFAHKEPLVFPTRDALERRFEATVATWRRWSDGREYAGPWREAVIRSALALKLLVFAPSGAIAAAGTTSLPEQLGGASRNWDYRFSWIRDSAFAIDALLHLGCHAEAQAYFWWLMHATQLTAPRLRVLYELDGGTQTGETTLPLAGYRGSRPVRVGNEAAGQLQLDTYGELLQTAWLYAADGNRIDRDVGRRLAAFADFACSNWREPDSGIWELRGEQLHFTQSKMMCAIALDRACGLAGQGLIPRGHMMRWKAAAADIRQFVDANCWSVQKHSYTRFAGGDTLDASLLLAVLHGYADPNGPRLRSTIDAISRELADGPFVHRHLDDDITGEGAFIACSFWLAEALARSGRPDHAAALMQELVDLSNDVGVYSEEIAPADGAFLGNIPQGLSHLALISAATAIAEASR